MKADVAIIGAGILGTTLAYFLSHLNPEKTILVIEQENDVAMHASSKNTGKVHAPYLYNPKTKRVFAKAAFLGFDMWRVYSEQKKLPFQNDGVIEVALDESDDRVLQKYIDWGHQNGLTQQDMVYKTGQELKRQEPNVSCFSAIHCTRDASVDYGMLTRALKEDAESAGARFILGTKAIRVDKKQDIQISLNNAESIHAKFMINAAGGQSIDIAHQLGMAKKYTDVHFRGEYLRAPSIYNNLTSSSVYSVPKFSEYPFLDPHWIIRVDGSCDIGPNAVPVFSPFGYTLAENIKEVIPKMLEMLESGAKKAIFDSQFQSLAFSEITSSLSKTVMIKRVQRFLPKIEPEKFTEKGFAGIRSAVINSDGKFEPDVILDKHEGVLNVLNYNSPGATGALPFCAYIIKKLDEQGFLEYDHSVDGCGPWKFSNVVEQM